MITKQFFKKAAKIGSEESNLSLKLRLKPSSLSKWGGTHSEVKSLQGIRSLWGTKLPYPQISCVLLPEFFSLSPPSSSPSTLLDPWGALILLKSFFFPPSLQGPFWNYVFNAHYNCRTLIWGFPLVCAVKYNLPGNCYFRPLITTAEEFWETVL